ncbi:MAG: NifB/NifX family molybdenum-iron cluster-binding protein [Fibrobacteraceae bacterium]
MSSPLLPSEKTLEPGVFFSIRVAVASTTGESVDQHFAKTPHFFIYEFNGISWHFVEDRVNPENFCSCSAGLNHHSFEDVSSLLSDCHFILAFQIGPAAAVALFRQGIRAHIAVGPVLPALEEFQKSPKFQHPLSKKGAYGNE